MRILTVRELTQHIKNIIDKDYLLANVWVKGEISNFKAASSGHFYFTLKDSSSTLKVVMFRSKSRSLAFRPDNGMAVIVGVTFQFTSGTGLTSSMPVKSSRTGPARCTWPLSS
jgi:exonuclease VII large subunit